MKINKPELKKINNTCLDQILDYLVTNFDQTNSFKKNLKKFLLQANQEDNFYGFYLSHQNDSRILGAILCPKQMAYFSDEFDRELVVYNLSTWYMDPSQRGLGSNNFIKEVIEGLGNCSITSYTSNDAASRLLKLNGFKNMNYFELKLSLKQWLKEAISSADISYLSPKLIKTSSPHKLDENKLIFGLSNSQIYQFTINDQKLDICIFIRPTPETFFLCLNLQIKVGHIFWVSDVELFQQNILRIFLGFFLTEFILFMNFNISSADYFTKFKDHKKYLYISEGKKFLIKQQNPEENFYWPIGSEKGLI